MAKPCIDILKNTSPEIHNYLREKAGIDFNPETGEGKQEWIKAAKELQDHSLKTLNNVFADLKVKGFEKIKPVEVKEETKITEPDEIKVSELIDKPITYKGEKATLFQDGKTVVAKIDGKNKEYELGNIDEIKDHPISDYGIGHETSVVNVNDNGNIVVRNDEFKNNYSNPLAAINKDDKGNIVSVNLETADGKKRTFRGNIAEDIAYQIHLKEINKNNESKSEFETFINEDQPTAKEINDTELSETTTNKATENNGEISREKVEPNTVKGFADRIVSGEKLSTPEDLQYYDNNKKEIEAELKKRSDETNEKTNPENKQANKQTETKEPNNTAVSEATQPTEKTVDEGNKPPKPPTTNSKVEESKSAEKEGTHINKEDITTAKDLVNKFPIAGGKVGWEESVNSALNNLSKEAKKGETLLDVAQRKINEWKDKINKELADRGKSTFNPSDEDLAVMSYYRTNINEGLSKLKNDLSSESEVDRLTALTKAKDLQEKLLDVDKVLSESGRVAGRSFYIRQAVAKMDAKNNLLVRRMDIMRAQNGEPLSADQEVAVSKIVSEENKLQKDFNNDVPKYSQEDFDAKVKQEVDRILRERKDKNTGTKKEKTFKQTGDEWADKIKKLKIKTDPNLLQSNILGLPIAAYNSLIDGISLAVKGGATIADAIHAALQKDEYKALKEEDIKNHLYNKFEKQDALDAIEKLSKDEKSDNITKSAVGKNLFNDLANTYIEDGLRGKSVFEEMNKDLKELFPNITEQQVRDAYLKTGEFKLDTKNQINKDKIEAQNQLKNIAKLESKLEDARKGKVGARTESEKRKWTETENRLTKELASELNKKNINLERSPKEEIDIKKKVAESHNDRMDSIAKKVDEALSDKDVTPEEKKSLKGLKNQLELSKVNSDTSQKIDESLIKASNDLRDTAIDLVGNKEIFDDINKSLSDLNNDIKNASQDILVTRYKKQLQSKIKESERKIEASEFNDDKQTIRNKVDAETINYEIAQRKIDSKYRRLKYLAEQKNKKWWEKGISLGQSFLVNELIGGIKTAGVVLSSGITKQPLNTLTNLTFGSLAHAINPELSRHAGAEAPISIRQEKNRYMAHYAAIGEKGMNKILDKSEAKLNEANKNYNEIKKELDKTDEGTPENDNLKKRLTKAENKQVKALLDHQSNFLFKWIGSNAWKDAGQVFTKGASQIDDIFGHKEPVGWKDMTGLEKTEFVMGMMGALHGTFKNFSARAEFAAGFTARLENKAKNGIDITQPEEILRTANDSFVNYLAGKYQEDNYVTSLMNRVGKVIEEVGNEPSRYGADRLPKNQTLGKIAAAAYRGKFPIIKTGVNIGREALQEYMLGSLWGGALHGKAVLKGIFNGSKEGESIKESIKTEISKMSPDKVDLIFRCYRKGGLGLVMAAFAALGYIKFGGFYNDDDWHRKQGELKQGELELFGHKLDHKNILAKAFEHAGVTMPSLMIANTREVYERKISRGKDKGNKEAAITDALVSDLEGAANIVPAFNTGLGNPLTNPSVPYGRAIGDISEYFDRNDKGEVIPRDMSSIKNRFLVNTGFRKLVPVKK